MMGYEDFDDILVRLGTSRWTLFRFTLYGMLSFMMPCLVLASVFVAPEIKEFTCVPTEEGALDVRQCSYFVSKNMSNHLVAEEVPCTEWTFNSTYFTATMTEEFKLVCDQAYLRPTYQISYMLGNFFGGPVTGMISDRFGRKTTFVSGAVAALLTTGLATFLQNIYVILGLRFITGFFHPAIISTGYILCLEICEPKYRSTAGIVLGLPWAIGTMWFGYLGFLVRDWRWLQRLCVIPILIFFCGMRYFPESPRWQIVRGKHDEAMKNLTEMAKQNKASLPPEQALREIMKDIQETTMEGKDLHKEKRKLTQKLRSLVKRIFVLWRTPEVRRRSFLMYITFIVCSTVYYGLSVNAVNFGLDPFMYTILGGLMEAPAYSITAPVIARFGRVRPTIVSFFVAGTTLITTGFVLDVKWAVITLAMTGKLFISSAYQFIYLVNSEIFPTEIRLQALGVSNFVSRIGSMSSPYLTDSSLAKANRWLPSTVFGIVSLVAGVSAFFLPESLNVHLPETIVMLEEETRLNKSKKKGIMSQGIAEEESVKLEA